MARTKQTARKSTGGRAPRLKLRRLGNTSFITITDHTFNDIKIFPCGFEGSSLHYFPFQVYILSSAAELARDAEFPETLYRYMNFNQACIRFNENCRFRVEIYALPQEDILSCIDHHEREKAYRKSQLRGPAMLNRKEVIVIDRYDWETTGVLTVSYTPQLLGRDNRELCLDARATDDYYYKVELAGRYGDDPDEIPNPLPCIHQDLIVEREKDADSLAENFLQFIWNGEGHEWCVHGLKERNAALGWWDDDNTMHDDYLGDKPLAKNITKGYIPGKEKRPRGEWEDEEDEDEDEVAWWEAQLSNCEDQITYGERCDPETAEPMSITWPRKPPLGKAFPPLPPTNIDNLIERTSVDTTGRSCTTIHHTSSAALFSFSLYLNGKPPPSLALIFALLNRGLLVQVPWRLHVYDDQSIPAALVHFDSELSNRKPGSGPVADARSPSNYSGLPTQSQSQVFLHMDTSVHLGAGPRFVTTNGNSTRPGTALEIMQAGSWENAAQMLFTYFTFCAETPSVMKSLAPPSLPTLTAKISVPQFCSANRENNDSWNPTPAELQYSVSLTLTLSPNAPGPVTFNTMSTILDGRVTWNSYLAIIDSTSGTEVPLAGMRCLEAIHWNTTDLCVQDLQEYGLNGRIPYGQCLLTLQPGQSITHTNAFAHSRLYDRHKGKLIVGKQYKIKLRTGITVPRWAWGTENNLQPPFGLGEMRVGADLGQEEGVSFMLIGPQDEEDFPAGSYGGLFGRGMEF